MANMKKKFIAIICALGIGLLTAEQAKATADEGADIMVDALVVRPVTLVGTVLGGVVFVLALPFSVPSKSVHRTADALVMKPADATFKRRMGDFDALQEY